MVEYLMLKQGMDDNIYMPGRDENIQLFFYDWR